MDKKGDRHYIIWKQQLCQSSYKARLKQKGGTLCLVGNVFCVLEKIEKNSIT